MAAPEGQSSLAAVNWQEILTMAGMSFTVGLIRTGYLIHMGRRWKWFDLIIEPCVAALAGILTFKVGQSVGAGPDILIVLTSLGAWGGPKTIAALDNKYLRTLGGADRATRPAPLDDGKE